MCAKIFLLLLRMLHSFICIDILRRYNYFVTFCLFTFIMIKKKIPRSFKLDLVGSLSNLNKSLDGEDASLHFVIFGVVNVQKEIHSSTSKFDAAVYLLLRLLYNK